MNSTDRYPGFWHAVLLCVLFVALQMALITPIAIVDSARESKLAAHPAVLGVVNLLDCALVLLIAWAIGRPHLPAVFAFQRVPALAVGGVVLATAGAVILLSEIDNLVRLVLPAPEWIMRYFREMASESGRRYWAGAFLLVLVAPVTEEILFRGLILRGFLRRFGLARAFLLSALLFGATHLNPWQFVSGTALGLMFAWWYARTRSLIPSLLGHALANAVVVAAPLLGFKVRGFNAGDPFVSADLQPLWFDGLGLVLLAAGLLVFRLSTRPFQAATTVDTMPLVPAEAPPTIIVLAPKRNRDLAPAPTWLRNLALGSWLVPLLPIAYILGAFAASRFAQDFAVSIWAFLLSEAVIVVAGLCGFVACIVSVAAGKRGSLGHGVAGLAVNGTGFFAVAVCGALMIVIPAVRREAHRARADAQAQAQLQKQQRAADRNRQRAFDEERRAHEIEIARQGLPGEPLRLETRLLTNSRQVAGVTVHDLRLPNDFLWSKSESVNRVKPYRAQLLWASDGGTLYVLAPNDVLHLISVPDFVLRRELRLHEGPSVLAGSREGIVVWRQFKSDLLVLDPQSLELKYRTELRTPRTIRGLLGAWSRPQVILAIEEWQPCNRYYFEVVDLRDRTRQRLAVAASQCSFILTPDGKYLLCVNDFHVERYAFDGKTVTKEQTGVELEHKPGRLDVSPDSQYVAWASPSDFSPGEGSERGFRDIYRVSDLSVPAMSIPADPCCPSIVVDPVTQHIYARTNDFPLVVYSPDGTKLAEYRFEGLTFSLFVAHPGGRKLVLEHWTGLSWAELPDRF